MKNIIAWFKSIFNLNKKDGLFDKQPPRDDYDYQDLLTKRELELDRILEKIQKHGIETITKEEQSFLNKMKK